MLYDNYNQSNSYVSLYLVFNGYDSATTRDVSFVKFYSLQIVHLV